MSKVSIIIPTLNEEKCLGRTLRHLSLLTPPVREVLVIDGGSSDATITIAEQAGASVLIAQKRGRSAQMNQGAEAASGDYLCFVHADTLVSDDLVTLIEETLADQSVSAGGFISLMAGDKTTRWGVTLHNFLKTYYAPLLFRPHLFVRGLRLLFGDQAIFVRRTDFRECGGFDSNLPIMEEADLCLKLVQRGRICLLNRIVQSSDRRVAHWGFWKANAIYLYIGFLWGVGVSPQYLKRFYEEIR